VSIIQLCSAQPGVQVNLKVNSTESLKKWFEKCPIQDTRRNDKLRLFGFRQILAGFRNKHFAGNQK